MQAEVNLSIHWVAFFKDRWPVNIPIGEDRAWVTRNRQEPRRAIRARKPHVIELVDISPFLAVGHHWSSRNAKSICEFGFALAPFEIFSRHGDLISNLAQIGERQSESWLLKRSFNHEFTRTNTNHQMLGLSVEPRRELKTPHSWLQTCETVHHCKSNRGIDCRFGSSARTASAAQCQRDACDSARTRSAKFGAGGGPRRIRLHHRGGRRWHIERSHQWSCDAKSRHATSVWESCHSALQMILRGRWD